MSPSTASERWIALVALFVAASFTDGKRPREPWVYRADVGASPSAVVVALDAELWTAFDPRHCTLLRAWRGNERSIDAPNSRLLDGSAAATWWLVENGSARALSPIWRGFELRGKQVALHYELVGAERPISVEETPEFVRAGEIAEDPTAIAPWVRAEMTGLRRSFRVEGLAPTQSVCLSLADELRGDAVALDLADPLDVAPEMDGSERVVARLPFTGADATNELTYFFAVNAPERRK